MLNRLLRFCLENKLVVLLLMCLLGAWGILVAPFDWQISGVRRDPVPVDAIPDTGENQQIVFTKWPGRSPQDVEDQITYPLTVALLGLPGVKTVRSTSMIGFSSIYVIFKEGVDFYWSRSRILEKLSSLPPDTLPASVQPTLGPDATPLGQVFWYTLEGRDPEGRTTGGWDLHELRSIQDFQVRYALASVEGVAEVASVGGYVQEYQVDVDPDAMRAHGVTLDHVFAAIRNSNVDVGARTIEVNRVEYVVRGLGFLKSVRDIENTVVRVKDNVPITVKHVARVALGPALRRGALDKGGAEAAGGVVVVRYGENPMAVIGRVKQKIREIAAGLPTRILDDGTHSRVAVVPFYDRSGLINETLQTLNDALYHEVLVTVIVVLLMVGHLGSALLISGLLPLAVLFCFVAMKQVGVDANIVALSGIAIAIGTMVDMGIVLTENIHRRLGEANADESRLATILSASTEVGSAVLTAVLTTVVSFLPVFVMIGEEGKLFRPLAFTKTFALIGAILVALAILPPLYHLFMGRRRPTAPGATPWGRRVSYILAALVAVWLALEWMPLGPGRALGNMLFTALLLGGVVLVFRLFQTAYEPILRWCLAHKLLFLSLPTLLLGFGLLSWLGFPEKARWQWAQETFPGLEEETMPALDEGSFLFMPSTSAHASIGESLDMLQQQDMLIRQIPEVSNVVGKIGRVESALDPAPVSMVETIIQYKPEYRVDASGESLRQWRSQIKSPDDIWDEIEKTAKLVGATGADRLQPIETRLLMVASGMRSRLGLKISGPDLQTIEKVGLEMERLLKQVPSVNPKTVVADRIVGKPYLEIDIDREAIARYGLSVRRVQDVIEVAIGGKQLTMTVEGRERYPVRVRYLRELRDQIESLTEILVAAPDGTQIPLGQLAEVRYTRGPQSIKSEDTFLIGYVLFGQQRGFAEVDVVEDCRRHLEAKIQTGELVLPDGVSYRFAGRYEQYVRAKETLMLILPLTLMIIFLIIYLQFRSAVTTFIVFSGVFVAWAGGFLLLWLYGQGWFMDFDLLGTNMRDLFQVHTINLSVAVWVGFLALFGIATDDGVLIATYMKQSLARLQPKTTAEIREAVVVAGKRRIRPALMTTATTVLALVPVLTATGRGADVMVPMAIPSVGGMVLVMITVFVVPTLYCAVQEFKGRRKQHQEESTGA